MKILFVSSEVKPFAKTGGLADVSASLPEAMAALGHNVMIVMPLYRSVWEKASSLGELGKEVPVPVGNFSRQAKFYQTRLKKNLSICFVKRDEFFDRSSLYGTPEGDYFDNAERFIFFDQSVLLLAESLGFQPDAIHCNDWQTSLIPVYLKSLYKDRPFYRVSGTVLTIHNLAYQGIFSPETMETSRLPNELFSVRGLEFYGKMNFLKGGILFADVITTVSEGYAREIQTPEFGVKLDGVLRDRSKDIFGVLNGVDYEDWNPEKDPFIAFPYSSNDLSGKKQCKKDLMNEFSLKGPMETPLIGMISRLAEQKGGDLVAESMERMMAMGAFLAVLGKGDEKYEKIFTSLARKHKGQLGVKIAFDNALAHKIEAGADMFLMPSRYEPCGLNQMYSLKYGTIPVVRATGGLDDTITEFDPETKKGNGFKFTDFSARALLDKIQKALDIYKKRKKLWETLMRNAMKEDFSWGKSARKYEKIYKKAAEKKRRSGSCRKTPAA